MEDQFCLMTEISIDISDSALKKPEKLSKSILMSAAVALYKKEKLTAEEAAKIPNVSKKRFLETAKARGVGGPDPFEKKREVSRPLTPFDSLEDSRYLARVLWALNEAERFSLPPMTASDIAKFVTANSGFEIKQTNTARFLRECRQSGRFEDCWVVSQDGPRRTYAISEVGRELVLGINE